MDLARELLVPLLVLVLSVGGTAFIRVCAVRAGRFGARKYLVQWSGLLRGDVHILSQSNRTCGAWNVDLVAQLPDSALAFYLFRGFRTFGLRGINLCHSYVISTANRWIYLHYLSAAKSAATRLRLFGYDVPVLPQHAQTFHFLRQASLRLLRRVRYCSLGYDLTALSEAATTPGVF